MDSPPPPVEEETPRVPLSHAALPLLSASRAQAHAAPVSALQAILRGVAQQQEDLLRLSDHFKHELCAAQASVGSIQALLHEWEDERPPVGAGAESGGPGRVVLSKQPSVVFEEVAPSAEPLSRQSSTELRSRRTSRNTAGPVCVLTGGTPDPPEAGSDVFSSPGPGENATPSPARTPKNDGHAAEWRHHLHRMLADSTAVDKDSVRSVDSVVSSVAYVDDFEKNAVYRLQARLGLYNTRGLVTAKILCEAVSALGVDTYTVEDMENMLRFIRDRTADLPVHVNSQGDGEQLPERHAQGDGRPSQDAQQADEEVDLHGRHLAGGRRAAVDADAGLHARAPDVRRLVPRRGGPPEPGPGRQGGPLLRRRQQARGGAHPGPGGRARRPAAAARPPALPGARHGRRHLPERRLDRAAGRLDDARRPPLVLRGPVLHAVLHPRDARQDRDHGRPEALLRPGVGVERLRRGHRAPVGAGHRHGGLHRLAVAGLLQHVVLLRHADHPPHAADAPLPHLPPQVHERAPPHGPGPPGRAEDAVLGDRAPLLHDLHDSRAADDALRHGPAGAQQRQEGRALLDGAAVHVHVVPVLPGGLHDVGRGSGRAADEPGLRGLLRDRLLRQHDVRGLRHLQPRHRRVHREHHRRGQAEQGPGQEAQAAGVAAHRARDEAAAEEVLHGALVRSETSEDVRKLLKCSDIDDVDDMRMEVSRELFLNVIQDPQVQWLMDDLEIPPDRADLFDILDSNGSGGLEVAELIQGLLRVRGDAKKSDIIASLLATRALQDSFKDFQATMIMQQDSILSRLGVAPGRRRSSRPERGVDVGLLMLAPAARPGPPPKTRPMRSMRSW